MAAVMAEEELKGNRHFSHFGADANLLEELEAVFAPIVKPVPPRRGIMSTMTKRPRITVASGHLYRLGGLTRKSDLLFYEGFMARLRPASEHLPISDLR